MYFLIDYENVNYAGLEGTEFLEKKDTISFFFSEQCDKIVGYRMLDITNSGCTFEICKLKNIRKNALDFYIASKVAEIFTMDSDAKIAIISADKDYQAVIDYWRSRLAVQNQLVRTKTIAKAINCVNGEATRKMLVNERMKVMDLQSEFGRYEERRKLNAKIDDMFTGTEYESFTSQIIDMVSMNAGKPRILYLTSLKSFGKKAGTEVYRKIKNSDIYA